MSGNDRHSVVPGQVVLPEMVEEMGYEAIILKPQHERFCWEYVLRGDNGSAAYKTVKPNVKDSTARVESSKLLTNPDVIQRIVQIRKELQRKYLVTAEDLVMYHGKVLKTDRSEFVDDEGKLKRLQDMDLEALSILDIDLQMDVKGNTLVGFDVPKRHVSAVELARIMGMHKEKLELTGKDGGPVESIVADDVQKLDALRARLAGIHGEARATS